MYNDIPACMIKCAFYDCVAAVHYKCFEAEFKDKKLPNGFLPDEFKKDQVYKILNARMNKAIEESKQINIELRKNHDKEVKAYRKAWRDKTMMQPLIRAKNAVSQDMFNHGLYDFEKFTVEFIEALKNEFNKQQNELKNYIK